jgi:hypothetical protein
MRSWSCSAVCMAVQVRLGPVDELDSSGDERTRAGSGLAALGEKSRGVGSSHGGDGIRKATVVGKGRVAQKAIMEKVGDRHLPREKVGPDKPRQDVEGKGGPFAELERLRLMIPKSRSTTRKKGSPQTR